VTNRSIPSLATTPWPRSGGDRRNSGYFPCEGSDCGDVIGSFHYLTLPLIGVISPAGRLWQPTAACGLSTMRFFEVYPSMGEFSGEIC